MSVQYSNICKILQVYNLSLSTNVSLTWLDSVCGKTLIWLHLLQCWLSGNDFSQLCLILDHPPHPPGQNNYHSVRLTTVLLEFSADATSLWNLRSWYLFDILPINIISSWCNCCHAKKWLPVELKILMLLHAVRVLIIKACNRLLVSQQSH